MNIIKSKITLLSTAILASTVTLAYAGFTEINSSGDIVSKDNSSAIRTSFSGPDQNINVPLRTYSLWDKISETTKYNATIKDDKSATISTPIAIEASTSKSTTKYASAQNLSNLVEVQSELEKTQNALNKSEVSNNKLKYENLELQVKVVQMNKDISDLKQQVNFLASQMEQVESEVLVMKMKKTSGFLARN